MHAYSFQEIECLRAPTKRASSGSNATAVTSDGFAEWNIRVFHHRSGGWGHELSRSSNRTSAAFRHHVPMVIVRRHWNGDLSAAVDVESLYDLHIRNEPGGVCSAFPRGFVCAHIWCDKMPAGSLGHVCKDDGPHELLVYVLPTDNPAATFDRLRAQTRG